MKKTVIKCDLCGKEIGRGLSRNKTLAQFDLLDTDNFKVCEKPDESNKYDRFRKLEYEDNNDRFEGSGDGFRLTIKTKNDICILCENEISKILRKLSKLKADESFKKAWEIFRSHDLGHPDWSNHGGIHPPVLFYWLLARQVASYKRDIYYRFHFARHRRRRLYWPA